MGEFYREITDEVWLFDSERLAEGAKPCPFCGNPYIKCRTRESFERMDAKGMSFECQKCDTQMWWFPKMDGHYQFMQAEYDEAYAGLMEKWNARAGEQEEQ